MAAPRVDDPLTADQLRSQLDYDQESGTFIWKANPSQRKEWNTRYAGKPAGTPHIRGYVQIMTDGRLHLAHRLAYLWMTGTWPLAEIDHKDGNRTNNAWTNLRHASVSQNRMNSALKSSNTSGYKGVYWSTTKRRWVAVIHAGGKRHFVCYADTPEAAHAAYCEAARRLHGVFARTT